MANTSTVNAAHLGALVLLLLEFSFRTALLRASGRDQNVSDDFRQHHVHKHAKARLGFASEGFDPTYTDC